jgi:hypothetical protein
VERLLAGILAEYLLMQVPDQAPPVPPAGEGAPARPPEALSRPQEIGGPKGPEPTRFGDWEKNGRCIDF